MFSLFSIMWKYMQIEDFRARYNGIVDYNHAYGNYTVPAKLLSGDCFEVINSLESSLSIHSGS